MTAAVTVDGADTFARTLAAAGRELENLTATNQRIAAGIVTAARPPIRTGRLAASITPSATATTAVVDVSVRYAGFVEARTGFLAAAVATRQAASLDLYRDAADAALATVRGA
jgi:phage gpG-like protein